MGNGSGSRVAVASCSVRVFHHGQKCQCRIDTGRIYDSTLTMRVRRPLGALTSSHTRTAANTPSVIIFGHIAKPHPHCPQSAIPWLVPPDSTMVWIHCDIPPALVTSRPFPISSFEGATYLMKCPRRRAELDTKHKSQRYDEIGQWHAWELTRSISHGPTSPPRICRNRVAHCGPADTG